MILERQCRLRSLPFWFRVTLGIRSVKRLPIGGARPIVRSPAIAGVMGGAMMGDRVENPGSQIQNQTACTTQNIYENRLTGYNVVYEYAGKQYNVVLPQDPGPTLQLQVTPLMAPRSEGPSNAELNPTALATVPMVTHTTPTVIQESRVVYVPTPDYRSYAPVYTHVDLNWGWRPVYGHGYSRRDGRWR